jgi:hypothetical protein
LFVRQPCDCGYAQLRDLQRQASHDASAEGRPAVHCAGLAFGHGRRRNRDHGRTITRRIDLAASWARAREQFAALTAERDALRRELPETRRERDDMHAALRELRAASLARMKAEAELASLYRERAIARARAAERDITQPLN